MPKREISSRPLNGKRNSSKLQTSPKKTPQAEKADWRSTKPTSRTTQRRGQLRRTDNCSTGSVYSLFWFPALPVVAVCVNNKNGSTVGIDRCNGAPSPTVLTELIGDFFPVPHLAR